VFPATFNKREIVDKQKLDETNNVSGKSHETYLPSFQETGRASEELANR